MQLEQTIKHIRAFIDRKSVFEAYQDYFDTLRLIGKEDKAKSFEYNLWLCCETTRQCKVATDPKAVADFYNLTHKQHQYQMTLEGVDISITAHTHKPAKTPSGRIGFDPHNNNVIESNTLIFVCTAWLNYGGYAAQKQLRTTAFYPDTIRLDGTKKAWR